MPKIIYIESNGKTVTAEVTVVDTVMQGAIKNGVRGILAECGGSCACGTCRVHIDETWLIKTGSATPIEEDIMDGMLDPHPGKRLSCQVTVNEALDGLVVHLPESQI